MMAHVIDTALQSSLFETLHVSTEDDEIAALAEDLGVKPSFRRPHSLADDTTGLIPVLRFVIEKYRSEEQQFDQAWLLMPCAPLLTVSDLHAVAERADHVEPTQGVLCVQKAYGPIERSYRMLPSGILQLVDSVSMARRSQDLPDSYFDAGICSVFPATQLIHSEGAVWQHQFVAHPLPRHSAVDIDNMEDWAFAELLYRAIHNIPATHKPTP